MSQGQKLRERLFSKYSANLHLLHDNGLLPHLNLPYESTYLCPLCLSYFSSQDLVTAKVNHLTLEDVPPKSLGGKPTILTCKVCNNKAGQLIESHLFNKMLDIDKRSFVPRSNFHAKFTQNGAVTQGEITVLEDGTIQAKQAYKHNKKDILDSFVKGISPSNGSPILNLEFYPLKFDLKRFEVALLKTAYLQCFEKYGYAFITSPTFDTVRSQIQNPDDDIYPSNAWFVGPFNEQHLGSHFISNHALECIMSVFPLKSLTQRIFGVILPILEIDVLKVIAAFHASIALQISPPATFHLFDEPNGYIENLMNINNMLAFIDKLKLQQS